MRRLLVFLLALPCAALRSWVTPRLGSLEHLTLRKLSAPFQPELGPTDVHVRVKAIGLNYADVFAVLGLYRASNEAVAQGQGRKDYGDGGTFCPGLEFAGEVISVGRRVRGLRPGSHVLGFSRFGAYRTDVVVKWPLLVPLPTGWTFEEGASLLVQGLTAWHGLCALGGAEKGKGVLVHSAAGGVGLQCLEICRFLGCKPVVAVVGSRDKETLLQQRHSWCHILVRDSPKRYPAQLASALEIESADGFDVCMDSLGGRYFHGALAAIRPGGRFVHFGATSAYGGAASGWRKWLRIVPAFIGRPRVDPGALTSNNVGIFGFNLIFLTDQEDLLRREVEAMLTKGGLLERPPLVGRVFPFEELPKALAFLRSGNSVGKVVVKVEA